MLRPAPFPISIEQLTKNELTECLGVPVASFTSARIGADRGMLGEIFLLSLQYESGATANAIDSPPNQVVVKFASPREESLASARRARVHEREMRCYDELLATTPINAPRCYGTWYNPETAHFMLVQDAVEVDASVDQIVGLNLVQSRLVLAEMAKLHARWWDNANLLSTEWLPALNGAGRVHNLTTLVTGGWAPLCELVGDAITPAEAEWGKRLPEHLLKALHHLASQPATLVHSDMRADNLLFSPDGTSVTVIDWQGCGVGPPGFDLAYFMLQSLTTEFRRQQQDQLLHFYQDQLEKAGLALTMQQITAGFAETAFYSLAVASSLPLISDPGEVRVKHLAASMVRRALDSLADHNLIEDL